MVARKYLPDVDAILARRHDGGADYWATPDGRLLVGSPFTTLESLLLLHELKVPRSHEAVRGALAQIWQTWREDGRFRVAPGAVYPCHTANAARILCRFGYARDRRMKRTIEHLLETAHDDGGWRCLKFSYGRGPETAFSNPGVTIFALDALRFSEHLHDPGLHRAVESLLNHWTVRAPTGPCQFGIGSLFLQVEYPFLRYNLFYYVYILSFYRRARTDRRFRDALQTLQSKLDERGRLVIERPHRQLAALACCRRGQPSELATRRYKEILANAGGS